MNDELPPQIRTIADRIADGWADTIDIGPRWFDLLARLDQQLAEISPGYVIEQCKTKFGTLRYYARPEDADHTDAARFSDIIRDAEDESATVCEDCGQRVGLDPLHRARTAADEPLRDVGWLIHHG